MKAKVTHLAAVKRGSGRRSSASRLNGKFNGVEVVETLVALQRMDPPGNFLKDRLHVEVTLAEVYALLQVERNRPPALRAYDQISMRGRDLLRQMKMMSPYLAGKTVAFVGDNDSSALMLGMLTLCGSPAPARMLVLDFDERLLTAMECFAAEAGFSNLLELRHYNVFDPLPAELVGSYDWFYTNPPYGSRNQGASGRLFITRGCELTNPVGASGCVILPDDHSRPWTRQAMLATQQFMGRHSWVVGDKIDQMHQYHLDDDTDLASCTMLVHKVYDTALAPLPMPYAGRTVAFAEIPCFYGATVSPPYPRYIDPSGEPDYDWPLHERIAS